MRSAHGRGTRVRVGHHHLTLVILAHFFLLRLQCRWGGKAPALTLPQAHLLVSAVLPRRAVDPPWVLEVLRYWPHRNFVAYRAHRKRRLARLNHYHELSL